MQPRLERLSTMLGEPLYESILWGHEYDLDGLSDGLRQKIQDGHFERLVFYGMGCSSVVSDIVKGFFLEESIPMRVEVVNDYESDWFVPDEVLQDDRTLAIIVCYSGWSVEPCLFFDKMNMLTGNENLLVLSGGGKIAHMCRDTGTSLIQYKLRHADREYPLYHVQQFFSIFLDVFHKLGLTPSSYQDRLEECVAFLKREFDDERLAETRRIAERLDGSRIALLGTAKWYTALLKQSTMFFNEISMVPTHRNLLHEFTHTEVAAYSDPAQKQAVISVCDADADDYTLQKVETLKELLGDKGVRQNGNIEYVHLSLDQDDFLKRFFYAHFFTVYVAYHLGVLADVEGRDLISIAAKNPWWSQRNIELHPSCVDIPSQLGSGVPMPSGTAEPTPVAGS